MGTLSIGLKKQVCGLPHCPQGTDLSASTTQVETRISSSLLESQSSKLRSLGSGSFFLAVTLILFIFCMSAP